MPTGIAGSRVCSAFADRADTTEIIVYRYQAFMTVPSSAKFPARLSHNMRRFSELSPLAYDFERIVSCPLVIARGDLRRAFPQARDGTPAKNTIR